MARGIRSGGRFAVCGVWLGLGLRRPGHGNRAGSWLWRCSAVCGFSLQEDIVFTALQSKWHLNRHLLAECGGGDWKCHCDPLQLHRQVCYVERGGVILNIGHRLFGDPRFDLGLGGGQMGIPAPALPWPRPGKCGCGCASGPGHCRQARGRHPPCPGPSRHPAHVSARVVWAPRQTWGGQ